MPTATSASATWRAPASASLNTATERIPIARSVWMTLTAISPRLATRTVWKIITSHPEHAVGNRLERRLPDDRKRQPQNGSGVGRIDHPVVPQPRRRVVGIALIFVLLTDGRLELFFLLGGQLAAHRRQHRRGLLAAHHRDARIRPHPQKPWRIRPSTHRIVACAVRAADDDGQL